MGFPYSLMGNKVGIRKTQVQVLALSIECIAVCIEYVIYLSEPQVPEIIIYIKWLACA